jgi:hypothetical protein
MDLLLTLAGRWGLQADGDAGAGLAGHFESTADGGGALAHAGKAVMAGLVGGVCW